MIKEVLAKWCRDYANDYRFTLNGELYDASSPEICEGVSNDILNCTKLEDVTDEYENYHPLMQRAVEYYDCELYKCRTPNGELVVVYFENRLLVLSETDAPYVIKIERGTLYDALNDMRMTKQ